MTEPFKVAKWGRSVPLADGVCHCGEPIKYNLTEGVIAHTADTDCTEPWPDVPNPAAWAASREMVSILQRGSAAVDRALGLGDQVRFVGDGDDRDLIVTSEPQVAADGTVTFEFADAEAYGRTERLRPWLNLPAEGATR